MPDIYFRPAKIRDIFSIYRRRNDKYSRKFAIQEQGRVPLTRHIKWFANNREKVKMIMVGDDTVGDLRIEPDGEVAIRIDYLYRGFGVGTEVLKTLKGGLYAKIVINNFASIRAFENAGFIKSDLKDEKVPYYIYKKEK